MITFSIILFLNLVAGAFFAIKIRDLKKLVETVYDNPLMASTYATSAKYRFEKVDAQIRTLIFRTDDASLQELRKSINSQLEQAEEDLAVVQERALTESSKKIVQDIEALVVDYKTEVESVIKMSTSNLVSKANFETRSAELDHWLSFKIRNSLQNKLTDLTDDAADAGYTFRLESEKKNNETIYFSWGIGILLLITTQLLALYLRRTIAKPISSYEKACLEIGKGDYTKRVKVFGETSEIAILGRSFNAMLDQVDEKDRNMKSLLDGLNTAVFSFDKNGNISSEKSKATDKIFEAFESNTMIDFFKTYKGVDPDLTKQSLQLLWDPEMTLDFDSLVAGVLPSEISLPLDSAHPIQYISINYRQHNDQHGKLEKIIVLAEDITEKVSSQKNSAIQSDRVERITKASNNSDIYIESKANFAGLIESSLLLLKKGHDQLTNSEVSELKRKLHSLKGELALMGHRTCSREIHHIETDLQKTSAEVEGQYSLYDRLVSVKSIFLEESADVLLVLGLDANQRYLKVDQSKFQSLKNYALQNKTVDTEKVLLLLKQFEQKPLEQFFKKYFDYVAQVSENLGKEAHLVFDLNSDEVSFSEVQSLDAVFGHLIRNSLDHGIEDPDERETQNKKRAGEILISCHRSESEKKLKITLKDDGGGINTERLIEKALEKQIWTKEEAQKANQKEAVALIFRSDLSTKDVVSETSGRGVGMDAVKDLVESVGGKIEIETERKVGSAFIITIPI